MGERRLLYFALGVLAITSFGGASPLALRDDGIQFPDGSLQTTAASLDPGEPIHDESFVDIPDGEVCSVFTPLFTVPTGKTLVIEWVSFESNSVDQADPVDVDIATDDGTTAISHSIARLPDSIQTAGSIFWSTRRSGQLRLFSVADDVVEAQACRNGITNSTTVRISFYGRLFDALVI